jgi:RNA polymerase sigma-70 factor (ECF subfamily)
LRTWIYRIALHEASNQRRWWRRHKQREVSIEEELQGAEGEGVALQRKDLLADPSKSPYESAVQAETRARVEAALGQIAEPYRTTLILRDIEGFVYEEVAEIQGVSLGTVKSRLARGRAALKTILSASQVQRGAALQTGWRTQLGEEAQ